MEEIEIPTEHLHEKLEEAVHENTENWVLKVALTAALLAVFAAITALLAGHHSNEAMIEQIKPEDVEKMKSYKEEQKEIDIKAREYGELSEKHLSIHKTLAKGVTLFQIAIAICVISALTRRKWLWY